MPGSPLISGSFYLRADLHPCFPIPFPSSFGNPFPRAKSCSSTDVLRTKSLDPIATRSIVLSPQRSELPDTPLRVNWNCPHLCAYFNRWHMLGVRITCMGEVGNSWLGGGHFILKALSGLCGGQPCTTQCLDFCGYHPSPTVCLLPPCLTVPIRCCPG